MGHTASLLSGSGQVLILGGGQQYELYAYGPEGSPQGVWTVNQSAELYDPATAQFYPAGSLNIGRLGHTATILPSGSIFVAGGEYDGVQYNPYPYFTTTLLNSTEIFTPSSGASVSGPNLSTGRSRHTATTLPNGSVLLAGGGNATADLYWPAGVPVTAGLNRVSEDSLSWGYNWNGYQGGPCNTNWYTTGVTFPNNFNLEEIHIPNSNNGYGGKFYVYQDDPTSTVYATSLDSNSATGQSVVSIFHFTDPLIQTGHTYYFDGDHVGPPGNQFDTGSNWTCDASLWDFYAQAAPSTDSITVTSNLATADFAISGPAAYSGSGTSATFTNVPTGSYTITFGPVQGYVTPATQTQALSANATIAFSGTYLPAVPNIQLSPSALVFEAANSQLSITATSSGASALEFTSAPYITGPNSSDFSVVGSGTTCTTQLGMISPGQTCTLEINYSPLTASAESAILNLVDNSSASPQMVPLTGTLQALTAQISDIQPNPISASTLGQSIQILGTGFSSGTEIDWADLTTGNTGTIVPTDSSPNLLNGAVTTADETATWQFQVKNPDGADSNCAPIENSNGTTTMPCYSMQILSSDLPHSYKNDYPFQNAAYCPNSTPQASCLADTDDPYGFFYRECTSYVSWRMNRDLGTPDPRNPSFFNGMGNGTWRAARYWNSNASALGYVVDSRPEVGAIAQWVSGCGGNCSSGHVAYVESKNTDGSIDISEYNYASDDNKVSSEPGDHQFGIRTISPSETNLVFIHIKQMFLTAGGISGDTWTFGDVPLGTSTSQALTISNPQNSPIAISSIAISGANARDFEEGANSCSSSIPADGTCNVTITFNPSAAGPRNGKLTVKGTAGTQILTLTGAGSVPLTVPSSASFGNVALGDKKQKSISFPNKTGVDLAITGMATGSSEFSETNTCGSTVAYKSTCSITVTFTPTAIGPLSDTLTIDDSAINSPQSVALTGNGIAPVQVSPAGFSFGTLAVRKNSAQKLIEVTNNTAETLTITAVSLAGNDPGDFSVSSTSCSGALTSGGKCSLGITFSPSAVGTRQAILELTDGAITSPQMITLTGSGK